MSLLHLEIRYVRLNPRKNRNKNDLRISFTTLPDHQKDNFTFPFSKMNFLNHEFLINYDRSVKEILFVIREKDYFNGHPIVGRTLILTDNIPKDQVLEKEYDILETQSEGLNDKFIKVGVIGIKSYFDNSSNPNKIASSNTMPTLSEIPAYDLPVNERPSGSFFRGITSLFKKGRNYNDMDDSQRGCISGSKSDFIFINPK